MNEILEAVAEQNGTTVEEVRREMRMFKMQVRAVQVRRKTMHMRKKVLTENRQ